MEFRILGPLEVVEDGNPVALGTLKERLVLGVLLLHANEFVSRERLIDDLWGEAPPPTARKAVNVYVSQLRKALGRTGEDPITTASGGYRLQVEPDAVDASRAQVLVASARAHVAQGELENAAEHFREALSLWRGPTLAGLQLESRGRDEVAQLDELRQAALMDRIDCDLALGRHELALGELNVLVREHPLRERLRAQQMLALYRADRQADALDAYAEARTTLVDDLGIEPSEALQRLQQAILRHDSALELPGGAAARNGAPPAGRVDHAGVMPPSRSSPWQRALRRRAAVAAATSVAVVAAVVALVAGRGGGHELVRSSLQIRPNSLARIDPATRTVVADVPLGIEPGPMALARGALWIVNRGSGTIQRYDLRGRKLSQSVGAGGSPYSIAADADGNVWVSERKPMVTWILHSASGAGASAVPAETKSVEVPLPAAGAEAFGDGYLWVIPGPLALPAGDQGVSRIDVRSRALASTIPLDGQTTSIAYGYGSAWIGTYDSRHLTAWLSEVRAGSGRAEPVKLETGDGWGPLAIATGAGDVWVLTSSFTLIRIDPETLQIVKRIPMVAEQPVLLAVGAGSVWTVNRTASLSQIDPRTNKVVRTTPLGSYKNSPCGIAATQDAVWVAMGDLFCDTVNR
ncbi:MAG TPA: BTAD domain-containing putative transcriptional regulator [Gaiellaceae bacterium]|nr:BTAD domain-containing putative transcriptional regulator [Gaiellaceae bacterium]